MKVLGIQSSPNLDGLTCEMAEACLEGAKSAGADVELVHLNKLRIEACRAHDRGWGTCREEGICMINDDFQGLREKIQKADALVFSTPVYFGDISESAKCFLDRWRRCERENTNQQYLKGKLVMGIANAGGGGRGAITALHSLETYFRRFEFTIFDLVPINRISKKHKVNMLKAAGKRMAAS
jgi:multimeric flavodoxin WrbA